MIDTNRTQRPFAPWATYAEAMAPTSSAGVLLSSILFHQVVLNDGFGPNDLASLNDEKNKEGAIWDAVQAAISLFTPSLQDGRFPTYARPFGGGPLQAIPERHWEIDDPLARFATSAYAFGSPFDPEASPTHWIFADHSVEKAIFDLHRGEVSGVEVNVDKEPHDQCDGYAERPETVHYDISGRGFLRRREVEALVGLKKSAIYAKIEQGRFPPSEKIGQGRAAGWRRADIEKWLEGGE